MTSLSAENPPVVFSQFPGVTHKVLHAQAPVLLSSLPCQRLEPLMPAEPVNPGFLMPLGAPHTGTHLVALPLQGNSRASFKVASSVNLAQCLVVSRSHRVCVGEMYEAFPKTSLHHLEEVGFPLSVLP